MASFDKNCFETPPDFYARCDKEFRFQLDAAAEPATCKHKHFVQRHQNVLNMTFRNKRIWLNPPYHDAEYPLGVWMKWAVRMCHDHGNTLAVLTIASTSTSYWHRIIMPEAAEIRAIEGRLWFLANGVPQ